MKRISDSIPKIPRKFELIWTIATTLWMFGDFVLDCLSSHKFHGMCLVRSEDCEVSLITIIQDNYRNFTTTDPPEYWATTGPVSCLYWRLSLGTKYSEF